MEGGEDGESILDAHLPPQLDHGVDTASGNHVRGPALHEGLRRTQL
jgi:hypothetical protein